MRSDDDNQAFSDVQGLDIDEFLPTIKLGDLAANATAGEQALLEAGVEIYQYCWKLMRPIIETGTAANGRKTKVARLEEVGPIYLRDVLARHTRWQSYIVRERKWVRKDPPLDIAKTILARVGEWQFPVIVGMVSTPTLRPDGSVLAKPGYDKATQLLLVGPPPMPSIPDRPTRQQSLDALAKLKSLLTEFPFSDDVSRAVALSAMITPIARGAFRVAPMHVCTATTAGSGKSYLGDVVAAMAIGQPMPVMAAGRTEEETEKRIGAALIAGQPLISIDNVNGGLGGDALCLAIERASVQVRILGLSQQKQVEARGTTLFATGNNLVVVGDVCRRVITARLDPAVERPELREFAQDPVATIMQDRGAFIAAALTVCRGYIAAGRPDPAPRLGSFEGWSDTVRSALIWLGEADPVASMDATRERDPEIIELRAMLDAWGDAIGVGPEHRCTVAEVLEAANGSPELAAAIQAVAGRRAKADARSLGKWLSQRQGRVVGDLRFSVRPNKKGGSIWWIENIREGGFSGVQGGISPTPTGVCQ